MFPNLYEKAWLYHRGAWSRIKNPLYNAQSPYANTSPHRATWRQILREYDRQWGNLGPTAPPTNYPGVLVYAYSYTGEKKAPQYLIRIVSLGNDEVLYAQEIPDLLEVLSLLAPVVSCGIFSDAYMQGQKNR